IHWLSFWLNDWVWSASIISPRARPGLDPCRRMVASANFPSPAAPGSPTCPSVEGSDYKVRLDIFEGPLDLLLYLIKKDEVDIHNISIARITSQYLDYIETFRMLNIDLAAEFIVMAANLMYLKSRTMLPRQDQPP